MIEGEKFIDMDLGSTEQLALKTVILSNFGCSYKNKISASIWKGWKHTHFSKFLSLKTYFIMCFNQNNESQQIECELDMKSAAFW